MKIKTCSNKGIHIIREDGITFSIQFGGGNYCDNYHNSITSQCMNKPDTESSDCEMAVFDKEGAWITNEVFPDKDDIVIGYVPIEQALRLALDWKR